MEKGASPSKKIEDLSKPTPKQPFKLIPGMVVLVKDPEGKIGKGLHVITEYGHMSLNWIAVAPMFGEGQPAMARTEWITVIPAKDLTITYLPQ